MDYMAAKKDNFADERAVIAAVVLLLQTGISAVTALGFWAYVAYSHLTVHGGQVLPLVLPAFWLTLGLGVAGGRAWARWTALGGEAAALLIGLLTHILPGTALSLTSFLTSLVLPAAVLWLLISPSVRRPDRQMTSGPAGYTVAVEE